MTRSLAQLVDATKELSELGLVVRAGPAARPLGRNSVDPLPDGARFPVGAAGGIEGDEERDGNPGRCQSGVEECADRTCGLPLDLEYERFAAIGDSEHVRVGPAREGAHPRYAVGPMPEEFLRNPRHRLIRWCGHLRYDHDVGVRRSAWPVQADEAMRYLPSSRARGDVYVKRA